MSTTGLLGIQCRIQAGRCELFPAQFVVAHMGKSKYPFGPFCMCTKSASVLGRPLASVVLTVLTVQSKLAISGFRFLYITVMERRGTSHYLDHNL